MNRGCIIVLLALMAILAAAGVSMAVETAPVATIDSVEPSPAYDTDTVRFSGDWSYDGTIESFLWESSLDGILSWEHSFETSDLSVGLHEITFKVMTEEEEVWSDPATTTLELVDYILEIPPWQNGDCWLWDIYMKESNGKEERMYVIEEVIDANSMYTGYPCFEMGLTYTMEGDDEVIEGTVWLSRETRVALGYEISGLDEPFGAFSFLCLIGFPVDVSEGSLLFDVEVADDEQVGNVTYRCVDLEMAAADGRVTMTYSPEARHIVILDTDIDGEVMVVAMKEAMDVEAVYSVLPEDPGPVNGNGGNNGGAGSGGSGGTFLDPMYITMAIVLIVVVLGALVVFVAAKRGPAPGYQEATTPTRTPLPAYAPLEGSVTDGTYEFQVMAPEKATTTTSTFLAFDGPPGSLGGPAGPTAVAAAPSAIMAPRGFRVEPGSQTNKLFWEPAQVEGGASISFYKVYRGRSPTDMAVLDTVGPEVRSYEDMDVIQGTAYHYKVSAETISGEGPASETVGTVMATPPTPPIYPSSIVEGSAVFLNWKSPPNDGGSPITGYQVHRGPSFESLQEVDSIGTEREFSDKGLEAGTHFYAITAETAKGRSPLSKVIEVEVPGTEG